MGKDPDQSTGKLVMDKAGLKSFLKDRVEPFSQEIQKIGKDDPDFGPSMTALIGKADVSTDRSSEDYESYGARLPLAIGLMNREDIMGGGVFNLNKNIENVATEMVKLFEEQTKLFGDIKNNMEKTIEVLISQQNENLVEIDGQEFLDVLEDVEGDLAGGQNTGSGKEE